MRPKSPSLTLICRKSIALVPVSPSVPGSMTFTEYDLPVRLSLISSVPDAVLASSLPPDFSVALMLRCLRMVSRVEGFARVGIYTSIAPNIAASPTRTGGFRRDDCGDHELGGRRRNQIGRASCRE